MEGQDAGETVAQFVRVWAAGDIDASMRFIAEDCVYALHISNEVLPFGGVTAGRANIEAVLRQIRDKFDYLVYRAHNIVAEGHLVRLRVEHMYRHRASGEILSGNFRLVIEVRDGLLIRGDEYHDRAMVEAFFRLFAAV